MKEIPSLNPKNIYFLDNRTFLCINGPKEGEYVDLFTEVLYTTSKNITREKLKHLEIELLQLKITLKNDY